MKPDLPQRRCVPSAQIAERVAKLFHRTRYRGDDGWTFWVSIAAIDAGLLTEDDVGRALAATEHAQERPDHPVKWFRKCLAEKAGLSPAELTELLRRVKVVQWGSTKPGACPSIEVGRASVCRPPPATRVNVNDRRNQLLNELAREV